MSATFTPGPWACHPLLAQVDAFESGEPVAICRLLWPTDLRSEAQTEANARLIAAAPDLLAEEIENLQLLENLTSFFKIEGDALESLKARIAKTRAAIAKATP